nr:hypothetical protein [Tanacetum cinerariifolium]
MPKVLLLTWEKIFKIQHAQPEDIHELLRKHLEDLQIINEELAEYINSSSWNYPTFYDDDDDEYSIQVSEFLKKSPIAIAPVLTTKDPKNSLSMGDEHLSTPREFVGELVYIDPIPSRIDETDYDPKDDILFIEQLLYDDTLSEDDSFEDIDYAEASPPDSELVSLGESPSSSFISYTDNSSPEFETFSDHTEETSSGSNTTHANNSLLEYDSFLFEIEPDQGELDSVVMNNIPDNSTNDPLMEVVDLFLASENSIPPEIENDDPSYPRPPEKPPDDGGILTTKVVGDISDNSTRELYVHVLNVLPSLPTLYLSLRGFKVFQLVNNYEGPMMIYRENISHLDVPFLHFYRP